MHDIFSKTSFTPQVFLKLFDLKGSRTEDDSNAHLRHFFVRSRDLYRTRCSLKHGQLQKQLDNNEFQEIGSMASFKVLETQFQMFIKSKIYLNDEYIVMTRNYFLEYTRLDIPEFHDTLIQNMDYVKKSIEKRALHKMEYDSRVNERLMQTTEEKVDSSKALDASLVIIESNGTESQEQDTSSRSGNDAHVDDADIRPIDNEEPMAEVQTTADDNVSATGQQHTEQPESNNEGEVDQNAEQCHDIRPLPAKLTDNMTTKLSDQLLESENVCLKKTVAQFQKYFGKLEAHCINLELQLQMENNVLKSGQQSQFLKEKGNEAKVKNDIDVIETINIELEHSVAKLLAENEQLHKENEHLKQTYKDLFDSIKRTRIQKKGFAIAALKNELRKLTGNSVNTKFAKPSILGKPVGQPLKNQSVVRQPTAFNSSLGHQCQMTSVHNSSGLVLYQMTSDHIRSELGIHDHSNEPSSSKLVPKVVPLVFKTATSRQELELLFHHHIGQLLQDEQLELDINTKSRKKRKFPKKESLLHMSWQSDNISTPVLLNVD
ncbi:hypothetical protein Tco_0728242 [Tanacetum coccineum]|uniref:Uncharacterized protein n=1 Tax=Tanacetum coccineum TaxID=301880 RepID=A0ABQ4YMX1_9ASTR